jgi:alpha-galactosidase
MNIGHLRTVVLGGASITWLPVFARDLCESRQMEGGTLVLMDADEKALAAMAPLARKAFADRGRGISVETTTNLRSALRAADFVVNSVLVGGHAAWKKELEIIRGHGIPHPKGMSIGPGGMIMGIKQIPFVVEVARQMEELAPQGWLLNFSNPMQALTQAVQRHAKKTRAIGLCHGFRHTIRFWANRLGIPETELCYTAGGVNHFEFVTRLTHDGRDLFPDLLKSFEESERATGYTGESTTREFYELFGAWPTNFDIHVIEYLPWYIRKGVDLGQFHLEQNDVEKRMADRGKRLAEVDEFIAGKRTMKELVPDKHSEHLDRIIDGVASNTPTVLYANVMNRGFIRNLSDDVCVEVPVVLDRDGYMGCCIGELPPGAAELSALHGAVQRYVVDAAMTGSRELCVRALSLDPMCFSLPLDERRQLVDELVDMNREYLPRFFR